MYFDFIVSKLNIEELKILGFLSEEESNTAFKALSKKEVRENVNLSTMKFRESVLKLSACGFVEVVTGSNNHKLYITDYGENALSKSLEGEM